MRLTLVGLSLPTTPSLLSWLTSSWRGFALFFSRNCRLCEEEVNPARFLLAEERVRTREALLYTKCCLEARQEAKPMAVASM